MHRFFVFIPDAAEGQTGSFAAVQQSPPLPEGVLVSLSEADSAHAARVLRLSVGDTVIVCDGLGYEYEAELESVSAREVTVRILNRRLSDAEPAVHVTLAQGIAKGDKMDFVVQKAVEVGISRIIPLITERTVVRLEGQKAAAKVERWRRIAYEAAKQSGRARIPAVDAVHSWDQLWRRDDLGIVIIPWEGEKARRLLETVSTVASASQGKRPMPAQITIVIGPEGGFAAHEIVQARQNGARVVTLGPRILRTETAGLVTAALVLGALGELG